MEVNDHLTEKARRDMVLVIKARDNGDQSAYAELMKHYRDTVYYMLLKMTNNPIDAEDLTIEAFGKAFRSLKHYSPDFAFSTWLFKIASNNCIDYIRRRRKISLSLDSSHELEDGTEMYISVASNDPDPEEELIRQQKMQLMREVVEKLKPHYRKLITLRYFDELSYEELAEELDLPLGTVKAQLFRARELLYNFLKRKSDQI
ncbi:MAG: sigma-70 family RNA polymerase sigma factor [Bacteroidales bacterium]